MFEMHIIRLSWGNSGLSARNYVVYHLSSMPIGNTAGFKND